MRLYFTVKYYAQTKLRIQEKYINNYKNIFHNKLGHGIQYLYHNKLLICIWLKSCFGMFDINVLLKALFDIWPLVCIVSERDEAVQSVTLGKARHRLNIGITGMTCTQGRIEIETETFYVHREQIVCFATLFIHRMPRFKPQILH